MAAPDDLQWLENPICLDPGSSVAEENLTENLRIVASMGDSRRVAMSMKKKKANKVVIVVVKQQERWLGWGIVRTNLKLKSFGL